MPASRASSSPTMSEAPSPWSARARYRPARRSAPRLARDDKVPLAPRLGPLDRHVLHVRAARPAAGPGDDRVHRRALALDLGLDRAVGAVPDPAANAEPPRLALHRAAEPHALHAAADDQVRPHRH